jgi:ATP-dependent Clp protease ATP-binding subunit ClpC
MRTYKFIIAVWQDHAGASTAQVVEESDLCVTDRTTAAALRRLKKLLRTAYERSASGRGPWRREPELRQARVASFTTAVRPQYESDGRVYPLQPPFPLPVWAVIGRSSSGTLICAAPTLGVRFHYHDEASLPALFEHAVQERLARLTPQQLSRFLPPARLDLHTVPLRTADKDVRSSDAGAPPDLALVAEPLDDRTLRRRLSRAWQRDREIADLARRLTEGRGPVLLVGESGVGKTAVLADAARQLQRQNSPAKAAAEKADGGDRLRHRFWLTSGPRLIAGMQYLGQWEERCERVVSQLSDLRGVLCIESLLGLVQAGGEPGSGVAAFLAPYLEHGQLRMVAEATPAELEQCRRLLPGFAELFELVSVEPLDAAAARLALEQVAATAQQASTTQIDPLVAPLVQRLFRRFLPYQAFPGQAATFVRQLFEAAAARRAVQITQQDAIEGFVRWTGLPEQFLRDDLPLELAEVVAEFRRQVIGQDAACDAVARLVTTFKAGLNDPRRPLGVLLFCGPTGVGKTELAKTLARFLFGHGEQQDRLIRLDMSEYAGYGAAERLLAQGDGEPSELVRRIRQQPFAVVLLDEIEKAGPQVFDVLLGMFDEGRLTDRLGRTAVFRSAIILMTSNLGATSREPLGFEPATGAAYETEAARFFRPEFFNRIDAVVTFNALSPGDVQRIAEKELGHLSQREGIAQAKLRLAWGPSLVRWLAREGYDRRHGARPLQRTIERCVVAPLARWIVEHPERRGSGLALDWDEARQEVVVRAE